MLEIVDYGDLKTKDKLQHQIQKIIAILPSDAYSNWGKIIDALNSEMHIIDMKTMIIPPNVADSICDALDINVRASSTFSKGVCLYAVFTGEDGFNMAKKLTREYANSDSTEFFCSSNGTESQRLGECLDNRSLSNTGNHSLFIYRLSFIVKLIVLSPPIPIRNSNPTPLLTPTCI